MNSINPHNTCSQSQDIAENRKSLQHTDKEKTVTKLFIASAALIAAAGIGLLGTGIFLHNPIILIAGAALAVTGITIGIIASVILFRLNKTATVLPQEDKNEQHPINNGAINVPEELDGQERLDPKELDAFIEKKFEELERKMKASEENVIQVETNENVIQAETNENVIQAETNENVIQVETNENVIQAEIKKPEEVEIKKFFINGNECTTDREILNYRNALCMELEDINIDIENYQLFIDGKGDMDEDAIDSEEGFKGAKLMLNKCRANLCLITGLSANATNEELMAADVLKISSLIN
jgi:hypothetical protein